MDLDALIYGIRKLFANTTEMPERSKLSFSSDFSVTDDPTNQWTRVAVTGGGGSVPTGTGFRHVTSGTEDGAAALVVDADVDDAAAIAVTKVAQGTSLQYLRTNVIGTANEWATPSWVDTDINSGAAIAVSKLAAGTDTYVLTTTGGVPVWAAPGGSPGGSDTQVQFNDGGSFNGESHFTYTKTTGIVAVQADGTGALAVGVAPATSGAMRLESGATVEALNNAGSGNVVALTLGDVIDRVALGDTGGDYFQVTPNGGDATLQVSGEFDLNVGSSQLYNLKVGGTSILVLNAAGPSGTDGNGNALVVGAVAQALSADFTSSTSTSQQHTTLSFALGASDIVEVEVRGRVTAAANTSGVKIGVTGPSSCDIRGSLVGPVGTGLSTVTWQNVTGTTTAISTAFATVSGETAPFLMTLVISGGGNAGTVYIDVAPGTTTAVKLLKGAVMKMNRVASV